MYLPSLVPYKVKRVTLGSFKGMNTGKHCDENEFHDTLDLSSGEYPLLTTVPRRCRVGDYDTEADKLAVFEKDGVGLVYQNGDECRIEHKGYRSENLEFGAPLSSANVLSFNTRILIIGGESAYEYDTDMLTLKRMGQTYNVEAAHADAQREERTLRLSLVYNDGGEIGQFTTGSETDEFPTDAAEGDLFARNLTFYRLIYKSRSNASLDEWQVQSSLCLRLDIPVEHRCFEAGDYIRIKGVKYWNWCFRGFSFLERFLRIASCDTEGRYITESIDISSEMLDILHAKKFPTNDIGLYDKPIIDNAGNDLYILEGELSGCMPCLDLVTCCANRVWGCSNSSRELFSSELGNARNWNSFEGIASDSYSVSIASPGDFTACIDYLGKPIFFKENEMVVIEGSRPANFHVSSYSCRGVAKDSPSGLCVVNDILYYKSHDGIYAYSGGLPICVSEDICNIAAKLKNAVLSGEGEVLLVSGEAEGEYIHLAYDTDRRIWHRYSSPKVLAYLRYPDATLEFCKGTHGIEVYTMFRGIPDGYSAKEVDELEPSWSFESGDISYNTTDRKYISRISLDTEAEGRAVLFISYNGETFKRLRDIPMHKRGCCDIALSPRRCDHFRVRMEGKGGFTLFAITKEIEEVRENG